MPVDQTADPGRQTPDTAVVLPGPDVVEPGKDATNTPTEETAGTPTDPAIDPVTGRPADLVTDPADRPHDGQAVTTAGLEHETPDDTGMVPISSQPGDLSLEAAPDASSATADDMPASDAMDVVEDEEDADEWPLDLDPPPGSNRQKNPVTRRMLRENFRDGKWRSPYDMALRLDIHIPPEIAAREMLGSLESRKLELSNLTDADRERFVKRAMRGAKRAGIFESRKMQYGTFQVTQYRYCSEEVQAAQETTDAGATEASAEILEGQVLDDKVSPARPVEPQKTDTGPATASTKTRCKDPSDRKVVARRAEVARTVATAGPTDAKAIDVKKADQAVNKIKEELAKLDRNDGQAVAGLIAAGVHLVVLQAATRTRRNWTERVKTIPLGARRHGFLNPRTARRLQELGESHWGRENETPGSKILEQLPTDLQKLTWLCKLSHEQLEDLLHCVDCKEEGRLVVINAVKAMLPDFEPSASKSVSTDKVVASFKQTVVKTATALGVAADDAKGKGDICSRLREALDEALADLIVTKSGGMRRGPAPHR